MSTISSHPSSAHPTAAGQTAMAVDAAAVARSVYRDGIAGLPGAFGRENARQLGEDFTVHFRDALSYPGGTVSRGPNRHYFSVYAEQLRGLPALLACEPILMVCAEVLGPDWQMVEVAFDVPRAGAKHQPWHRDFATPPRTARERVLTSLAFNITTVDVEPDMGPFEIAPGTHWDDGSDWVAGMFPPREEYPRYDERRSPRLAKLGDVSVRTGLTIHRGTANRSTVDRGVLILGMVSPDDPTPEHHRLTMTRGYFDQLPAAVQRHLRVHLVDRLEPRPRQLHDIEGLLMGAEPAD